MTRGSREVDELIREAKRYDLKVEKVGYRWEVTNPAKKADPVYIPTSGVGHSLSAVRRQLRELAEPPNPMVTAIAGPPAESELAERAFSTWSVAELLKLAGQQGISVRYSGAVLHVVGPMDAEPVARLLRDRADDVIAHLNPNPPTKEDDVAQVRDIAKVTQSKRLAADAQALGDLATDEELIAALAYRLKANPASTARIAELETANEALRSRNTDLEGQVTHLKTKLATYEAAAAVFRGGV